MSANLVLIFLLLTLHAIVLNSQNTSCNTRDLMALRGFLKGIDSSNLDWSNATTDCCIWAGVKCKKSSDLGLTSSRVSGQRVIRLNLANTNLKGLVLKSLASLDQLQVLNLSSNALSGDLPPELFHLQHLKVLDLSRNKFSSSIPSISNLSSLKAFDISNNLFSGFHPVFPTDQPLNLTRFVISSNLFTGPIDTVSLCASLPQIEVLDFSSNRFSGSIPHGFGHCKSMTDLFLNSNLFSGSLPDDLFELSSLRQLHLHGNELSGQLNERFQNLSNLFHLDISNNGFYGNIPEIFTGLRNLVHFSASSNNFSGPLPITLSSAPLLSHLDLRNNSLQGRISINCSQLANLNFLDLASNQFKGTIPDQLSLCTGMKSMNLDSNQLEGLLPKSWKSITDLSYLSLSNNGIRNISRTLQILQQCMGLNTLVLAGNFQGEEMPINQIEGFNNLKVLSIPNCSLYGQIPPWLSNCTQLNVLDLSRNRLTGRIPSLLGGLSFLSYLNLSHNHLTGEIPFNITLHSQRRLLPQYMFMKLPLFPAVPNTARNQLTEELQYNQFLRLPPSIDLSKNQLMGPIPAELGGLKDLIILDLSWNHLSTTIPENLSKLLNLEILDLSNNNLTGHIPPSLASLNFLSWFNVANNRLEGEIPTGGQFSTFPKSSFEGNLDLCGEYIQPCDGSPPGSMLDDNDSSVAFNGLAFGIGTVTGFIITVIVCMLSGFCYVRDEKVIVLKLFACSYVTSCLGRGNQGGTVSASSSSS